MEEDEEDQEIDILDRGAFVLPTDIPQKRKRGTTGENIHETTEKKRAAKCRRNGPKMDDSYKRIRTVCVSLSSLMRTGPFGTLLHTFILQSNQLRVMGSYVLKEHLRLQFEAHAGGNVPFEVNLAYMKSVFQACCTNAKPRHRDAILYAARDKVCQEMKMEPITLTYQGYDQVLTYMAKNMLGVIKSHVKQRLEQALKCWVNNSITSELTPEVYRTAKMRPTMALYREALRAYERKQQGLEALRRRSKVPFPEIPFADEYMEYREWMHNINPASEAEEEEEADEEESKSKMDVTEGLRMLWTLRKDSTILEELVMRPMKGITMTPLNHIHLSHQLLDTRILASLHRQLYPISGKTAEALQSVENQEWLWDQFFDLRAMMSLRPQALKPDIGGWRFHWSVTTNNMMLAVRFSKDVPKTWGAKPVLNLHAPQPGRYLEKTVLESLAHEQVTIPTHVEFKALDPGKRSAVTIRVMDSSPLARVDYELKSAHYRQRSGLTEHTKFMKAQYARHMSGVKAQLDTTRANTVDAETWYHYLRVQGATWEKQWKYAQRRVLQSHHFRAWSKRKSFIDKEAARIAKPSIPGKPVILLWGGWGNTGGSTGVKGGGGNVPLVQLKSQVATQCAVIPNAAEFRTSKCGYCCGAILKHPYVNPDGHVRKRPLIGPHRRPYTMHAVSYCPSTDHRHMLHRDGDGALKIGCRFLAQVLKMPLGVWDFQFPVESLELPIQAEDGEALKRAHAAAFPSRTQQNVPNQPCVVGQDSCTDGEVYPVILRGVRVL